MGVHSVEAAVERCTSPGDGDDHRTRSSKMPKTEKVLAMFG
jgi:hypothetical protein